VLPKASCGSCTKITRSFEQTCARDILGRLRMVCEMPTDHPDQRPKSLPIEIERDGTLETHNIAIPDHPATPVVILSWAPPGILRRGRTNRSLSDLKGHSIIPLLLDQRERLDRLGVFSGSSVYVPYFFDTGAFAQLLAKICYALAVAEFGPGGFTPYLRKLIRGLDSRLPYLVGRAATEHSFTFAGARDHIGTFELIKRGKRKYLCANIQLFSYLQFPVFMVVVGRPMPTLARWLANPSLELKPPYSAEMHLFHRR
jgi:hypothetical protein